MLDEKQMNIDNEGHVLRLDKDYGLDLRLGQTDRCV